MKTTIDIEDLLIWAYRDMEADRVAAEKVAPHPALGTSWAAVDRASALGALVRVSPIELLPGDCDDAALVHRAVLDLDDAFFTLGGGAGEATVLDRAMILAQGGEVERRAGDRATATYPGGESLDLRTIVVSVYLVLHARGATRPDCYADVARRRGRPRQDGEIAPGLTFDEVMFARAVYAVWHAALGILAADLGDRLARWSVTGPKADEAPWLRSTGRVLEAIRANNSPASKPLKKRRKVPD